MLVLSHGFTQTSKSSGRFGAIMDANFQTKYVDAPGHGNASDLHLSFEDAADRLASVGGNSDYLGYSMGGRLSLAAAIRNPGICSRLVLISASPGIASEDERMLRRESDELLADTLVRSGDIGEFVDNWLSGPLFQGLTHSDDQRASRLSNTPDGLASSLRLAGTGAQQSLWDRLGELKIPVLFLAGELDAKFTDIALRMSAAIGKNSKVRIVAGAGHALHLEQPEAAASEVLNFLETSRNP